MKVDTYRAFEMDVTKEELKTIKSFCSFLDEILDYNEDYEEVFDIVRAIAYELDITLKERNFKINIKEENKSGD